MTPRPETNVSSQNNQIFFSGSHTDAFPSADPRQLLGIRDAIMSSSVQSLCLTMCSETGILVDRQIWIQDVST